jgi:hypothetical protein
MNYVSEGIITQGSRMLGTSMGKRPFASGLFRRYRDSKERMNLSIESVSEELNRGGLTSLSVGTLKSGST